jgi:uncharacterized protein (TIGR00369 family)
VKPPPPTHAPLPQLPPSLGDDHHRRLERIYHAAPTNRLTPAHMVVGHGEARLVMELGEEHRQAVGGLHGMVAFKVLDETAFYAANSLVDDVFLATSDMTVHFTAGARAEAGELRAEATVVSAGRSAYVVDAVAWTAGDEPTVVARATGTFVRTKAPLPS